MEAQAVAEEETKRASAAAEAEKAAADKAADKAAAAKLAVDKLATKKGQRTKKPKYARKLADAPEDDDDADSGSEADEPEIRVAGAAAAMHAADIGTAAPLQNIWAKTKKGTVKSAKQSGKAKAQKRKR